METKITRSTKSLAENELRASRVQIERKVMNVKNEKKVNPRCITNTRVPAMAVKAHAQDVVTRITTPRQTVRPRVRNARIAANKDTLLKCAAKHPLIE
jgi:hypothetical protein